MPRAGRSWLRLAVPALLLALSFTTAAAQSSSSGGGSSSLSPQETAAAQKIFDTCCKKAGACQDWKDLSSGAGVPVQTDLCALSADACQNGKLVKVNMSTWGLDCVYPTGTFSKMSNLVELHLYSNKLQGNFEDIAADLAGLDLQYLDFYGNQLKGNLAATSVCNLIQKGELSSLSIGSNQVAGTVPSCLFNNNSVLFRFVGQANKLTGSIPGDAFTGPTMQYLYLGQNQLTGSVPASLATHPTLNTLILGDNKLSALDPIWTTASNEVSNGLPMQVLDLSTNRFTGSFPQYVLSYPDLQTLYLYSNKFSGPLPELLPGQWSQLSTLDVSFNSFSGQLPSSWVQLATAGSLGLKALSAGPLIQNFDTSSSTDSSGGSSGGGSSNAASSSTPSNPPPTSTPQVTTSDAGSGSSSSSGGGGGLSAGAIAGIVIGVLAAVVLAVVLIVSLVSRRHIQQKSSIVGSNRFQKFVDVEKMPGVIIPPPPPKASKSAKAPKFSAVELPEGVLPPSKPLPPPEAPVYGGRPVYPRY